MDERYPRDISQEMEIDCLESQGTIGQSMKLLLL